MNTVESFPVVKFLILNELIKDYHQQCVQVIWVRVLIRKHNRKKG